MTDTKCPKVYLSQWRGDISCHSLSKTTQMSHCIISFSSFPLLSSYALDCHSCFLSLPFCFCLSASLFLPLSLCFTFSCVPPLLPIPCPFAFFSCLLFSYSSLLSLSHGNPLRYIKQWVPLLHLYLASIVPQSLPIQHNKPSFLHSNILRRQRKDSPGTGYCSFFFFFFYFLS